MQHHGSVPVPCGVLVVVACVLEVDVGGHGECSPGGFVLGQAAGQQGIEVAVGLCPCTGGLVQFAGHVIADGFLSAVGSPLAVAVVVVNITASLGIDLFRVTHLEAQDVLVEVIIEGGGVHGAGCIAQRAIGILVAVAGHCSAGVEQGSLCILVVPQQLFHAIVLCAIGLLVVVEDVIIVRSVAIGFHILFNSRAESNQIRSLTVIVTKGRIFGALFCIKNGSVLNSVS